MCGIWAWIHAKGVHVDSKKIAKAVEHIVARGPEGTRIKEIEGDDSATFAFTRLAINGLNPDGMQPFTQGSSTWMCNGEIYNSRQIETLWNTCQRVGQIVRCLESFGMLRLGVQTQ